VYQRVFRYQRANRKRVKGRCQKEGQTTRRNPPRKTQMRRRRRESD
jgi:hypothetical protein